MDFKISRSSRQCSVCSRRFDDGEKFHVGLMSRPREDGVFDRVDICRSCWDRQGPGNVAAHWVSQFSREKKHAIFDPDFLWSVFHKCRPGAEAEAAASVQELSAADRARFAYVAALGLVRMKQLKSKNTRRTARGEFMMLETSGRREKDRQRFEILSVAMTDDEMQAIQDRLAELA
ncbi:hypothetical protein EDM80_13400 [bacterium]|nr:MAG: hypothetical protein EDM80_13400 [bacterium]RIK60103.1 MAG: hypothetical protein DCC64_14990 [Planctomycetota bacterium]